MRIARPLLSAARTSRLRHCLHNGSFSSFSASLPLLSTPCRRCLSQESSSPPQPSSAPFSSTPSDAPSGAVIFSGIQPTGVPHLGNYLGALLRWVQLQDAAAADAGTQLYYSVVDLHALTSVQASSGSSGDGNGAVLRQRRRETLAAMLAIGLDPERCVLFYQSAVPAHSELMWLLSCTASVGYLSRMTQWKVSLSFALGLAL